MHFLQAASKYLEGASAMWVVSVIFQTMPPVGPNAPYALRWLNAAVQGLAANMNKAKEAAQPPLK